MHENFTARSYVQIKKLAGGEQKDCRLIGGLACTKNVAHRDMNTRITDPRILLLQCAIVYQRMEGRFMSLEPVMMQVGYKPMFSMSICLRQV